MINQIIPLGDKNLKVFGFNEKQIIFSSKGYNTFESLIASSEKSNILEVKRVIPLASVLELSFNKKSKNLIIKHSKNGKVKKTSILLADVSLREPLLSEISKLKNFQKKTVNESKTKPLLLNIIAILSVAALTWAFRDMAIDAQNGIHYEASGRNSGLKQLIANAVEAIGPLGVTLIGILGLIYIIFITYKRYNKPAVEIKFNRN